VQIVSPTQPTPEKFNELVARKRPNSAQRWIAVDPPSEEETQPPLSEAMMAASMPCISVATGAALQMPAWGCVGHESPQLRVAARMSRASAFVHRLVSAKLHSADALIVTNPFDDADGLMRADGMPAELLLPWRTTAAMLGGGQYLGQIELPEGSENRVFLRPDGQVVMVAWNAKPTNEVLYLGNNVRQFDLLGRSKPAEQRGKEQVIHIGPTPTFVLGLHEAVTRWQMNVRFESIDVPSIYSKPHHNGLAFKNYFPQGVGGSVRIVVLAEKGGANAAARSEAVPTKSTLDRWTIEPPQSTFQLAADAETKFPFDIKLKNALYGTQPVRIDFTVEADERVEFSVYRKMEVGTADLTLDVRSHLDKDGVLIVEQRMTNRTSRLADFKCHLRSKGRQPQRMQVYRLGGDADRKLYRFADGAELLGKEMLLEIEELNGPRIMNYRFVARDEPRLPDEPKSGRPLTSSRRNQDDRDEGKTDESPRPLAKLGS
jgi:hypothetical protein